jgi:excisionase family DNA binding protein
MAHAEVDFTFEEALRTLGVTPEKLDKLIEEGKLEAVDGGYRTLIPRESILRYMATVTMVGKDRTKKGSAPAS